jgi:hypothetical protein
MDYYVLECSARECVAEFYLNDIPVVRRGPDLGLHFAGQSNQYLVDGRNELSVLIHPGPTPGEAISGKGSARSRREAGGAEISAALCRYPPGATVGGPSREELVSLAWTAEGDGRMVFPRVVTVARDLGPLFGRWAWQDAPKLSLDDASVGEIGKMLEPLRESLHKGDPEPFIESGKTRLEEIARAYDRKPGEKKKIIRKTTADEASRDWWGIQPLETKNFDFRLCARGRLVELVDRAWKPVLRERPDGEGGVAYYDMMVGRIRDRWEIVR